MKKILVIGSVNKDFTVEVDRAPNEGETIISNQVRNSLGGKGANQAVALARLEIDTAFIGKVGEDNNGYEAIEAIQNNFVKIPVILKSQTTNTGVALIILEKNGNNRIIVNQGANNEFDDEDFVKIARHLDEYDYDYYLLQLEIKIEFIIKIINYLHSKNKFIILNPAPAYYLDDKILAKINLIIPNEHEFSILTGTKSHQSIEELITLVKQKSIQLKNKWIVTLGEKGSLYIMGEEQIQCKAVPTKVVDTTAAGDTFIAAFLKKFSEQDDIKSALKFASKASSITISRQGALDSVPFLKEIT